jgi:protein O-mannosyl-transferase
MIEPTQRRSVLICLCLAGVIAAVYWPIRHFEFTNYDDSGYVSQNPQVQRGLTLQGLVWAFTTNTEGNWHPLTWLSHMLDCQLFGLNAGAHHLVNVLFHIANALLLFGVLRRMTAAPWRSAFVAGLFALHPLHVESVAWVAERKDLLSALFWMLTMWAYVRHVERPNGARYWLTLGLYALGLMAKPMVVTLPFVLLLLDYWPLGRTRWAQSALGGKTTAPLSRLLKEKLPFLALAAASCVTTVWAQHAGGAVVSLERLAVGDRVANAVVSYVRYMGKTVWPVGLAAFYPHQMWPLGVVLGAFVVLAGVTGGVIWRCGREPHFLVGWMWYVGTLVPVIGLVQVGSQSMADRYSYIPLIGLFLMVAWGAQDLVVGRYTGKLVATAAAAVLLVVCAVVSRVQLGHWENGEKLFRHALRATANNFVAHYNLGQILFEDGKFAEAMTEYKKALQINPDYVEAVNSLGLALAGLGRTEEAKTEFEKALRMNPNYVKAHNNLGLVLAGLGRTEEAMAQYREALRIDPRCAEAHNNLGNVWVNTGRFAEAVAEYREALGINPRYAEAHSNLGFALANLGRMAEAIAAYAEAVRIKPDYAEAHYSLGVLLAAEGKTEEALAQYREAVRLRHGWPQALRKLAWLLATAENARVRNAGEAVQLAERLCEITGQQQADALVVLAAAYAEAGRFTEAVRVAQKALELAKTNGQQELAVKVEGQLKLYQGGRPFHERSAPLSPR